MLNVGVMSISEFADEMLMECNAIKNELRISTHIRPQWDVDFLRTLNLQVKCDFDISCKVQKDMIDYDPVPLFAISAVKK